MKKDNEKTSLLNRWKNRSKEKSLTNSIEKAPLGIKIPLSHGQKMLWFLQQIYPENPFYNYSEKYTFSGDLQEDILIKSLKLVYNDHDILRTTYHIDDNEVFQKIDNTASLDILTYNLSSLPEVEAKIEADKIMETCATKHFDLNKSPLVRIALIKISTKKNILLITLHHIVTDKWSMRIFRDHLASYYKSFSSNENHTNKRASLQYSDYAYWLETKKTNTKQLDYWKNKLSGEIPNLDLPTDHIRPLKPSFAGAASYTQIFNQELSNKLLALSKELETTPYVLMLTVYYLFLYRLSGQTDILIGSPVTNRDQKVLEELIGFFNDTIVLRTKILPNMSFKNLVKEVKKNTLEAFANKDIPFDVLVKELKVKRSLSVNPFFQAMFLYHSVPENPFFSDDLKMSHTWFDSKVSKFDLTIYISEENGILSSTLEYASDLFNESTINRFQNYFKSLIEGVVSNPNQSISEIPMLSDADKHIHLNKEKTSSNNFEAYTGIHNIIENIAENHPENLALTFGENSISYKTLNEKANQVAQNILKNSTKNNEIVGLCIERSLDLIIGMLGILKAGCAYLPIDPEYPKQRVSFMLKDAKVNTIVSQNSLLPLFDEFEINLILIDQIDNLQNSNSIKLPVIKETGLAYVIYTSGSTGIPKGVPITHKNIINSTAGRLDFYDENPSAFLLMSSISFDSSKAGIFWTLCTGGNLVIAEKRIEQDIEQIANVIEQHKVSHTLMLPSLYHVILENIETNKLKSLTTVMVAGEACSKSLCDIHFKTLSNVSLYNEYGPTEASVWCIAHKIVTADLHNVQIPIGKAIANAQIYLLDDNKNKVPFGTSGEIYIGGEGLSKGYLNRPELTSDVFINNPFNTDEKLYKTGDLAKYKNDGTILFLGRIDQQIKIRGYRVELDDIENTINKNELVEKSVVIVKQDEGKPKRLIAYLKPNESFDENKLKHRLKEELPDYMVPSSFILIDDIPLLPNGKIDKKSLSKIDAITKPKDSSHIEKPKNDIEQKLLDIWEGILNIKPLSITDNFFEIGGDSILSIQIIARARKAGLVIAPNQLFEHQTISELAMFISLESESNKATEAMVLGEIPLTPIQEWFFDTHKAAPEYWNQIFKIKDLPKAINKNDLSKISDQIIKANDALRLSFYLDDNKWKAKVLNPNEIDVFITVDISNEKASDYAIKIEQTLQEIQEKITLGKGNLFKCIYFETGDNSKNVIILLAHHLVTDFVSWQIILNAYTEAIHNNKIITQSTKTASIRTWGNYLFDLVNSKTITDELDYWKDQITYKTILPKDFENSLPIVEKDVSVVNFEIDNTITNNLISNANKAYNTKIDDLLLTALIDTLSIWTNNSNKITLAMERHGRESINTTIDLSNTIGWFTAFFPRTFNFESTTDIASKIVATKEQMRQIPNGGIGYGALRYLTSKLGNIEYPEIVFNYLGKQTTGENNIEFLSKNTRHPFSERHYYIEINALIKNGILGLSWSYSNKIHKAETIKILIDNFNESLKNIVNHCMNAETVKYTPSDFEDVDLDQDELDNLLNDLEL